MSLGARGLPGAVVGIVAAARSSCNGYGHSESFATRWAWKSLPTADLSEVAKVGEAPQKTCFELEQQVSPPGVRPHVRCHNHGPLHAGHARRTPCTAGPSKNW